MKTLIFLLFSVIALTVHGQQVNIQWGPEMKKSAMNEFIDMIGRVGDDVYMMRRPDGIISVKRNYVMKLNDKMMPVFDNEIQFENKKQKLSDLLLLEGNLVVFSNEKNDESYSSFFNIIDLKGKQDNKSELVNSVDYNIWKYMHGYIKYVVSPDKSKVVAFFNQAFVNENVEKFGFQVYDNKMNKLWRQDLSLPFADEMFELADFKVDNDGNVYFLMKVTKESSKERRSKTRDYYYTLHTYKKNGFEAINISDVNLITNINMKILDNGDILLAGYYSERNSGIITGSFYLKIDKKGSIYEDQYREFDQEFLSGFITSDKDKPYRKDELANFILKDIIVKDDGGMVLVGERSFLISQDRYDYNVFTSIIITKVNPDGRIAWNKSILKKQVAKDNAAIYCSYALAVVGDQLFFIYNDDPRNLDPTKKKIYHMIPTLSIPILASVHPNGEITKKPLLTPQEKGTLIVPRNFVQTKNNEILVRAENKKNYKFGKIQF